MLFSNVGKHVALAALPQTQQQSGSGDAKTGDQSQQQGKTTAADSPELSRCGGVEVKQSLGTVSVGCPKVWRSDRVFSVLDGIMRDVDSMTIRALEGLDANAANQAAIDLIQNSFDLTAKYDQAAAINNQFALQKLKTARTNEVSAYNADADFRQKLIKQRNDLTLQLFDAQATERQQTQAGTDTTATQKVETSLQNQITSINNTLNTTPPSISDASLASTASTAISSSDQPQHATLDKMPQGFQDALTNLLKQPTFPPAIAMDNVIDLLHQRIAREFAVIYDDLMRDSEHFDVYLVQFDTSINPKSEARDRGVHVEMAFKHCDDQTVSVPLAYELYPSAAAYNIMHGFNQTTHVGITGIAQTVVGFGLQASFQHDHSSLRSGLSQSIYASGFGAGQCKFGWDFAPAPNENRLAPGLRTTYAILRVPKGPDRSGPLQATLRVDWTKRDRRYPGWNPLNWHRSDEWKKNMFSNISVVLPRDHVLRVTHVSYVPADTGEKGTGEESNGAKPAAPPSAASPAANAGAAPAPANASAPASVSAAAMATPTPRPAVIQVRFDYPVDPNLIVTVNDQILKRVRDVRGRGLYSESTTTLHLSGNAAETNDLSGSRFGLLESDSLGEDTWFQADSRTILLNVGRKTAGTDHFPVVRIIDPSAGGGGELTALAREADEVRVGEWFFTQTDTLTSSSFQPLFTRPYGAGRFEISIQNVETGLSEAKNYLKSADLRIVSHAHVGRRPIYLNDQAQVVIEADADKERYILPSSSDTRLPAERRAVPLQANWAMDCRQDRGALICPIPLSAFRQFCAAKTSKKEAAALATDLKSDAPFGCLSDFKVWVDQAPYYGRLGLWGDQNLKDEAVLGPDLKKDLIPRGSYRVKEEKVNAGSPIAEYMWIAELDLINFDPNSDYCIPELAGTAVGPRNTLATAAKTKNRTRDWTAAQLQFWTQEFKDVSSKPNTCAEANDSAFLLDKTPYGIRIQVPFAHFLELPESLHLERIPKAEKGKQQPEANAVPVSSPVEPIELPSLRDQLIPGDVKIIDLGQKKYQFQGEHMRAVHSVYVTNKKDRKSTFIPIQSNSYNALEVDASSLDDGANYTIQLGIGDGRFGDAYVDLFQSDKTGLETQQVLAIPPKATPAKPDAAGNASGATSQTTTITASAGATPTATVTQTSNGTPKAAATASTTGHTSTTDQTQKKKNGVTQNGAAVKGPTPTPTKTPGAGQTPTPSPAATKTPSPAPAATKTPTPGKKKKNDKGTK
jgi:hypothetical protein